MSSSTLYPGSLFTLVGPAGAGKNAVMNGMLERVTGLRQFPTATTRPPREYEQEGREHYFYRRADFEEMMENGELLEHQVIHGNLYGIPRSLLERSLRAGEDLVADIDMHGAVRARDAFPRNTVLIFIAPPSVGALAERMRDRGESEAEVGRRLLRTPSEMQFAVTCDYVILNDTLTQAIRDLVDIITWERKRRDARLRTAAALARPVLYVAQALVLYQNLCVCRTDGALPASDFQPDELPHRAVLRAIRPAGILPMAAALTTQPQNGHDFIPPVYVEQAHDDRADRFRYHYVVHLQNRAPLAPGWEWRDIRQIELPVQVRAALPAAEGVR